MEVLAFTLFKENGVILMATSIYANGDSLYAFLSFKYKVSKVGDLTKKGVAISNSN
jgi:hypothetical protein